MPKEIAMHFTFIGNGINCFDICQLPTVRNVLARFLHAHISNKIIISKSCLIVASELIELWKKYGIEVQLLKHVIYNVRRLYTSYINLKKKNINRQSNTEDKKRKKFKDLLDTIFKINSLDQSKTSKEALNLLNNPGKYSTRSKTTVFTDNMNRNTLGINQKNPDPVSKSQKSYLSADDLDFQLTSSSNISDCSYNPRQKKRRIKITDKTCSMLDRTKLTDRSATYILAASASDLGHDIKNFSISRSTIKRARKKYRAEIAESLKKLLPEFDNKTERVDRLAVLVSGNKDHQLLGVPKNKNATGINIALSVVNLVKEWNLESNIKAMCFDTTSVNTGHKNEAAVNIEKLLEKQLLHLECRHHIYELCLEAVISHSLGPSTSPNICIFIRFQKIWKDIKEKPHKTILNSSLAKNLKDCIDEIIIFSKKILSIESQPRDVYKEFLELAIIILGGSISNEKYSFKMPGATSRARWMAKGIYSLKIWMFQEHFQMTDEELLGIEQICTFVLKVYIKGWFLAPLAISAPRNDLNFLKSLINFININKAVATKALEKFKNHLGYLSEELICLAFFDDQVSINTKKKIVVALKKPSLSGRTLKTTIDTKTIINKNLHNFVTSASLNFFNIL